MHGINLATLDSAALSRRLGELAGQERDLQVEFLRHLDGFDARRGYLEAGYPSVWEYCLRHRHLREGAAARRIAAMRVLRRFPSLDGALRDGRLCLSTAALLAPLLTDANLDEVVAAAAYLTKREVEHLVAARQPRIAPREGVRKRPERGHAAAAAPLSLSTPLGLPVGVSPDVSAQDATDRRPAAPAPAARPTLQPVAAETYSLRVTIDADLKEDLDLLTALLSHKVPDGSLASVLREAIRCAIEKHGKRRGAVAPKRASTAPATPPPPSAEKRERPAAPPQQPARAIPAAVRREVWKRDGGRCTWTSPDGQRCGSRWKLELDHVRPVALGGDATLDNLRLRCRGHNVLHAEEIFGRIRMARFRRAARTACEVHPERAVTSASGSALVVTVAAGP